ncbi:MAG: response regulator [Cyanobacteriota bacterium]|nr:response regulator [Cyanobacteriota bacterium]
MHKVAVLDDSRAWCSAVELALSDIFSVKTFEDTCEFINQVESFDLAMVDYALFASRFHRFHDGYQVICHLRQALANPPLLVLVSAFADDDLKRSVTQADACLEKADGLGVLRQTLQTLLSQKLLSPSTKR